MPQLRRGLRDPQIQITGELMSLNLQIDEGEMRSVIAAHIMKALDQKNRDQVISDAIAKLIEPVKRDRYSDGLEPGPLEKAFTEAILHEARKVVTEIVKDNAVFWTRLREHARLAMDKVFEGESKDQLVQSLADGILRSFTPHVRNDDY
jgi:hypothetical protein